MIDTNALLGAYRVGYFPMSVDGQIKWFSPERRGILPLEKFRISRRLKRVVNRDLFEISINRAFHRVVVSCASRPDPNGNWIDGAIVDSYAELHTSGHAHSVEAWYEGSLVGGLYGVALGGAFCGESMYHAKTDASKVALVGLVERLSERGYTLLDIQWLTSHLAQFGAIEVPRSIYMKLLTDAIKVDRSFD